MPAGEYGEAKLQAESRLVEAVPDWDEMRALVEATKVPGYLVTYKKGEADRPPTRGQSLEITRFLIALGFTAADLRAMKAQGLEPARAYVQQNGSGSPENRAVLVQEVIVGEVTAVDNALLGDGFRSTVRFRVTEGLKGNLRAGDEALVRSVSGSDADGKFHQSNEEPMLLPGLPGAPKPGTRWLINLSEGILGRQARLVGGKVPPSDAPVYGVLYGIWPVDGDRIGQLQTEPSPGRLSELRIRLRPVDQAYDAAAAKAERRLMSRRLP